MARGGGVDHAGLLVAGEAEADEPLLVEPTAPSPPGSRSAACCSRSGHTGLGWHYYYAPSHDDSAYISARTGDKLTVYVCGNTLTEQTFTIEVADPTTSDNIVISKKRLNNEGFYDGTANIWNAFCFITDGAPGMDTIKNQNKISGIPFATRTDSLMKYLEKAPNATWEFVWVDGVERTDLKNGDILKVTAEDNSVKEYFIKVDQYRPSHNANISAITWPDIPNFTKLLAVPVIQFQLSPQNHNYSVRCPMIPKLQEFLL